LFFLGRSRGGKNDGDDDDDVENDDADLDGLRP
jgi:hypothetical protein